MVGSEYEVQGTGMVINRLKKCPEEWIKSVSQDLCACFSSSLNYSIITYYFVHL